MVDRNREIPIVREIVSRYSGRLPHPEIIPITEAGIRAAVRSAQVVREVSEGKLDDLKIEIKSDMTLRTIADLAGDFVIVQTIQTERPYDDISIEESGFHKGVVIINRQRDARVQYNADSLDGTRSFAEGKPWPVCAVGARNRRYYLFGAIVHPFRQKLAFAMRGMGAYVVSLDDNFEVADEPQKMTVSNKTSFAGATIAVDSYKGPANYKRKYQLLEAIDEMAFMDGGLTSMDAVGSNIAYQLDVALGITDLGLSDFIPADIGTWDWSAGEPLILESDGEMLDAVTGRRPTRRTQVVLYGNHHLVRLALPHAQIAYNGYNKRGFKGYDFEEWKREQLRRLPEDPISEWAF